MKKSINHHCDKASIKSKIKIIIITIIALLICIFISKLDISSPSMSAQSPFENTISDTALSTPLSDTSPEQIMDNENNEEEIETFDDEDLLQENRIPLTIIDEDLSYLFANNINNIDETSENIDSIPQENIYDDIVQDSNETSVFSPDPFEIPLQDNNVQPEQNIEEEFSVEEIIYEYYDTIDPDYENFLLDSVTPNQMTESERELAYEIFEKYNKYRISVGLTPVSWDERCANMAYQSAYQCGTLSKWQHRLGIPLDLQERYSDILATCNGSMTADMVIEGWRTSSGMHRQMMECPSASIGGCGVFKINNNYYYIIVYDFIGTNYSHS